MSKIRSAGPPTSIREIREYRGLLSWVSSVDHKQIGILYLLGALFFFLFGLSEAASMRIQLARPENHFLSSEQYNQIFTGVVLLLVIVYLPGGIVDPRRWGRVRVRGNAPPGDEPAGAGDSGSESSRVRPQ